MSSPIKSDLLGATSIKVGLESTTMRFLILISFVIATCACTSATPAMIPPPSPSTLTQAPRTTFLATPNSSPSLAPKIAAFTAALRPEYAGDLQLVRSPTIYRLNLHLDSSLSHLTGQENVTFTNRTPGDLTQVYFRLFGNYPSADSTDKESVASVSVDGVGVNPSLESQDTALRVPLAPSLAPNGVANFELQFELTVPMSSTTHYADFTNTEGIITLPSICPLIPAYDEQGWHTELPPPYGDLVYAESSFYDVSVTAPMSLTLITSGSAIETTTGGAEKTWHFVGAPMRDFDVVASAALAKASATVGDVTVNSYYLRQDGPAGNDVLKTATAALTDYEKRIGPYPFAELDVVESPTTAGGIEYPGLVVISDRLYRDVRQSNSLEFDVAHEVGHQWWYSVVGDDQVNNPWMDEAFVQYTTLLFFQDIYGQSVAARLLNNIFQAQYDLAKKDGEDMPVGLPVSAYNSKQYGEIVYGKGPLFFDAVRKQIGDDSYNKFMQTYYRRFKYKIAKPDDLLKTIDEVSAQKVDALYDQWILGK